MRIAVDAAGGDYAPHEIVKGALKSVHEYGVEIALVGRRNVLHVLGGREMRKAEGIDIVDASQVIESGESAMKAVQTKTDSSIVVGINLVRQGKADAFVSAGNTGAVLAAAFLNLGRVKGVERPAIGAFLDTMPERPSLLIDAGANADCRPKHLVQFAHLGSLYSRQLLGIEAPRVAILSNGGEAGKGNKLVQDTYALLVADTGLNFIGNVEGHDIFKQAADVIVTDGFTGNIVIKTSEGLSDSFITAARQIGNIFSSLSHLRGGDLLRDIGLGSLAKRMDYREYGGACLLGVNGTVIIAHGRSRARTIKNAIGLARDTAERQIAERIREEHYGQDTGH